MTKIYHIYIMSSISGVLYVGVTNNLVRRVWQHKMKLTEGFTKKYNCFKLVYFEEYQDINEAIAREKQLKRWGRLKKENLINKINPKWRDLLEEPNVGR
ncbi:hypothetical protein C0581_04455 [Candidatus Parcubacteria bacterium]|nr:MAG: hypothetical protein C0581_04455 [Candidatus Parcubacteria bacterium]